MPLVSRQYERSSVLTKHVSVTLLLLILTSHSIFGTAPDFDYADYYGHHDYEESYFDLVHHSDVDEVLPVTSSGDLVIDHKVKMGDTVMLPCPRAKFLTTWWLDNGNWSIDFKQFPANESIKVENQNYEGDYKCDPPDESINHRIIIVADNQPTESTTDQSKVETQLKETNNVEVESEYFLSTLIGSFSKNSNDSLLQTLMYRNEMAKSSVAATNLTNWYFVFSILICSVYKFR